jgi:hypothetical protein
MQWAVAAFSPLIKSWYVKLTLALIRMEVKTHTTPCLIHLHGMVHLHIPNYTYDKSLEAKIAVLVCNNELI